MGVGRLPSPARALFAIGAGTCLSLLGDASLYAVLPTHTVEAGISVASVGVILSANRFIRLILNGPAGLAYDRWGRRRLFVASLVTGACSTAIYGFSQSFWPLLLGRLLWGLSWSGIWVGGNTIVLDVASDDTRGRWVGLYQIAFFLGSAGGSMLGGLLTDQLGYHQTMLVSATLTFAGVVIALIFLPETRGFKPVRMAGEGDPDPPAPVSRRAGRAELTSAMGLYTANRLAVAGMLQPTLGLLLLMQLGERAQVSGHTLGVATLTGMGLGLSTLIAMTSAPVLGRLSDRADSRWRVAAGGLVPGVAGFGFLAMGMPLTTVIGVPLTAITSGSNQSLSTALIGDLGSVGRQSRRLGVLFTAGDLASAVGPPLAYALIPVLGIRSVYLLAAGLFAAMFLVSLRWTAMSARRPAAVESMSGE